MILTDEIKASVKKSVLCWLATSDEYNLPNVSPKEVFDYFKDDLIIIANIASPQSIKNILVNNNVCISFIDVLVQKGFQIKGKAEILNADDTRFLVMKNKLEEITKGVYPFKEIISIKVKTSKPIIAPSYLLFPDTTEQDQIQNAKKIYGLD